MIHFNPLTALGEINKRVRRKITSQLLSDTSKEMVDMRSTGLFYITS